MIKNNTGQNTKNKACLKIKSNDLVAKNIVKQYIIILITKNKYVLG